MQPDKAGEGIRAFVILGPMLKGLVALSTRGKKPKTLRFPPAAAAPFAFPVLALKQTFKAL